MIKFSSILLFLFGVSYGVHAQDVNKAPRIINIVNFIRQTDYRVHKSDSLLYETVEKQIELLKQYRLPATFLLQYDALINPLYQNLLKQQLDANSEIGAWWEITQPHVESAGIKWRGEHSWVSHANIAFTTGYSPKEREQLVDVYMEKFKSIFGVYPKSVGSWFIDSHTLAYMVDKYQIVASCNCKDQIGTDGYTLWGGYWNQAYYPSRTNAYMPAQTKENQIKVPIFRMLGSDPIYQYECGLGGRRQCVISMEPVYPESGMNKNWVNYFLESIVNQPCLAFNYAQVGQENSFTWAGMQKGLEMQMPLFDSLLKLNKIKIETLEQSGTWFNKCFDLTPTTAVTTLNDFKGLGNQSVWFNSRYYRVNLLWTKLQFRFRDFHLFDEQFRSAYFDKAGTGNQFMYFTLPIVDGFLWSTADDIAGLRLIETDELGNEVEIRLKYPKVSEQAEDILKISCSDTKGNRFTLMFYPDRFEVNCTPKQKQFKWVLKLKTTPRAQLPFVEVKDTELKAQFNGFNYSIQCTQGKISKDASAAYILHPTKHQLVINCTNSRKLNQTKY